MNEFLETVKPKLLINFKNERFEVRRSEVSLLEWLWRCQIWEEDPFPHEPLLLSTASIPRPRAGWAEADHEAVCPSLVP